MLAVRRAQVLFVDGLMALAAKERGVAQARFGDEIRAGGLGEVFALWVASVAILAEDSIRGVRGTLPESDAL